LANVGWIYEIGLLIMRYK